MNGWGWFGMLMMVIITAAIVGFVVWTITARGPGSPPQRQLWAREQLDARLAQGDIDTQEYHERIEALSGHRPGTRSVRRSRSSTSRARSCKDCSSGVLAGSGSWGVPRARVARAGDERSIQSPASQPPSDQHAFLTVKCLTHE